MVYYINNTTGLRERISYFALNICDSEVLFPLTDTYITQISNLFVNCPFVEAWGLPPLSTIASGKVEQPIRHNWPFSLIKKDVSFIIR